MNISAEKTRPIKLKLPRVKLAWRDVLTLEQIFRDHFDAVKIYSEKYNFSSCSGLLEYIKQKVKDDIFKRKMRLNDLKFETARPFRLKLELTRSSTKIETDRDSFHAQAVSSQLENILRRFVLSGLMSRLVIIVPAFSTIVAVLVLFFKDAWWSKYLSIAVVIMGILPLLIQEPVVDLTDDLSVRLYDQMSKRLEVSEK